MPTHIFIQHGMWDRVSENNQSAYDAARELWQPGDAMAAATHALDWGQYGDLQLGNYAKARHWIDRIESMAAGGFLEGGPRQERGDTRAVNTVALLKSRYVVETEEWSIASVTGESTPMNCSQPHSARTGWAATRCSRALKTSSRIAAAAGMQRSFGTM